MDNVKSSPKTSTVASSGFSKTDLNFMKIVELKNLERVNKLKTVRRNNIITGSILGVGVLSIYVYSIFAVKQERFLDDFIEPATVHKE